MLQYLYNIVSAIDRVANAILGGDPRETISSRLGKAIAKRECLGCRFICHVLDWFQIDHCTKAVDPTVGDRAIIPD